MALEPDAMTAARVWGVLCLVLSGLAYVYVSSLLEDCRSDASITAEGLQDEVGKLREDIIAWGGLGGGAPLFCGVYSILA